MRRKYFILLFLLGAASAFLLSQPIIYIALYYVLIGIFVNPLLIAIPFLFVMLAGGIVASYILPDKLSIDRRVMAGALITLGILCLVSLILNLQIDYEVNAEINKDMNQIQKGINIKNLAVITSNGRSSKSDQSCDENCIRLLLNHQVEKYIVPSNLFDYNAPATGYYFEKRQNCPAIDFSKNYDANKSVEFALAQATQGNCIISYPARLQDADFVIEKENHYGVKNRYVNRISAYTMKEGNLNKVFQKSKITYSIYGPVFGFVPNYSGGTSMTTELWRMSKTAGSLDTKNSDNGFENFLNQTLRLKSDLDKTILDDALDAA